MHNRQLTILLHHLTIGQTLDDDTIHFQSLDDPCGLLAEIKAGRIGTTGGDGEA